MEAYRWRQLREAADVIARVPRAAVELWRPQATFNHALLDLLERWPAVGADLERECDRLEALAVASAAPPRSHREGLGGRLVTLGKRAILPALELGLAPWVRQQREQNLERVRSLRRREPSTARVRYQRFDILLDRALPEILRVDSYETAYREWIERVETKRLVPPPPTFKVTIICQGSPSASWLSALLKQKGQWDCIFTEGPVPRDARFRVGRPETATTDWVLWVSAHAELAPDALQTFAACTDVDLAYADEDCAGRVAPFFKPSFCSELARERDLLGGAVWVRRSAMKGGTPLEWALNLPRKRIRRVHAVLSHRTTPYVFGERVVRDVPSGARVSIVVPFRDKPELLAQLLDSAERFPPGVAHEWLFVDNGSARSPALPGRVVRDDGPFNWSRLNNLGARHASGTHLLFLNNDVEAASRDWLRVLMEYASLDDVGAVGANLWYPDGTVQHSGVALGVKGLAGHVFSRWREGHTPFGTPLQTRQVSAVTGACLLTPRALFERLGGFDEQLPISGGDVEYCLRTKLRVLNVPHVKLIHHESLSRSGIALTKANIDRERAAYWPHLPDPFYNPNLTRMFTSCAPDLEG